MKKRLLVLILLGSALTYSCSSGKKSTSYQNDENEPFYSGVTTSYGPGGKIIKNEKPPEDECVNKHVAQVEANADPTPNRLDKSFTAVNSKVGTSLSKINKNAGENFNFLMTEMKSRSFVYNVMASSSEDLNENGNQKMNGFAIAGFSVSIVGLFIFGVLFGAIAIVFSALSLNSQRKGLAIAGLIIGIVDVVVALILIAGA